LRLTQNEKTDAYTRRVLRLAALAAVCLLALDGAMLAAGQSQVRISTRPDGSVAMAERWVEAVLGHTPGKEDAHTNQVGRWSPTVVRNLLVELESTRVLMRNSSAKEFRVPQEFDNGRETEIRYSGDERTRLDRLAARIKAEHLTDLDFVARAIVLHTDVGIFENGTGRILRFTDGQQMALESRTADHWLMTRSLARLFKRNGDRDADLALWYRATIAWMTSVQLSYPEHVDDALARFPNDAELQFQAGCLHEILASQQTQTSLAASRLPANVRIHVDSPGDELKKAAARLRRALEIDASHNEARLHLGRILTLTGAEAAAIPELRRAASEVEEIDQQYYAQLFLGAALEATNDEQAARDAYRAAAALVPQAQAPRLALSYLAASSGDRAEARAALSAVLDYRGATAERTDPWWRYSQSSGRPAASLLDEARRRLATPSAR
jgi:tetratricopeptide (TPR) repeat protein